MTKYIFVTGGVISGLGKGVISASIGSILQMLNQKDITIKKLDPYLNIDPGTMNPIEHGEVFVTNDGAETDLDLGYYERFLNIETTMSNSTSSGQLFKKILEKERNGDYLGKTVQMIPHFTDMIKDFICKGSDKYDYIICEIGGCVGDIEAMAFYEAIRQLINLIGVSNILFIHLTYLVYYSITNELKTKPTQNTIRDLQQVGITPDILICRAEHEISSTIKDKLSLHVNIPTTNIIEAKNVSSIYEVPQLLIDQNIHQIISKKFSINPEISSNKWTTLYNKITSLNQEITIGLLGKYNDLNDSYKSLLEALSHAGWQNNYKVNIQWINAREDIEDYNNISGVVIPGGFGTSGIENMLSYIKEYRENSIPVLGICLGMQLMVIEYCRNILGMSDSTSYEFSRYSGTHVITKIDGIPDDSMGGNMRLGSKTISLQENTKVRNLINKKNSINERQRHRYIVNPEYIPLLLKSDFRPSGFSSNDYDYSNEERGDVWSFLFTEIVELKNHPWFIGCQYHPEYQSNPFNPHPLFLSFIENCIS